MKTLKNNVFVFIIASLVLCSCTPLPKQPKYITSPVDYDQYVFAEYEDHLKIAQKEINFWCDKLKETPNQYPYLGKIASAQTHMFTLTGDITYLKAAENELKKVNQITQFANASYLRSLAYNYITQHRFKEALALLEKAKTNGENLEATHKMLFDVHLELGNYAQANHYLSTFKNGASFDYLIRLAKWNDHNGNLDTAIDAMELATSIAEQSGVKSRIVWAYTNLADFYGHDGNIQESYQYYLKTLSLDSSNAYAKQRIAWIVYSYEKNPKGALRILDKIQQHHQSPDYYLLKAEIATFMGDASLKERNIQNYLKALNSDLYGTMYNSYLAKLYLDELNNPTGALELILKEVEQRSTAESYDLLAWAFYKNNDMRKALEIAKSKVKDYTYEPEALYHLAEIYKANGYEEEVQSLKLALEGSNFELGPVLASKIAKL